MPGVWSSKPNRHYVVDNELPPYGFFLFETVHFGRSPVLPTGGFSFASQVKPDEKFIENYSSIVPDITELANYNLGLNATWLDCFMLLPGWFSSVWDFRVSVGFAVPSHLCC